MMTVEAWAFKPGAEARLLQPASFRGLKAPAPSA